MKKLLIVLVMLLPNQLQAEVDLCQHQVKAYEDLILEYQSTLDGIEDAVKDGNLEEIEDLLYRHRDSIERKIYTLTKVKEKINEQR